MPRVIHFEIQADDPQRAVDFYKKVFDWKIDKSQIPNFEYWLIATGEESEPGINGAITKRIHPGTTNTISVASIEDTITKVEVAGGKITQPKTEMPGVGYFCYCADSEGNAFGIMESKS